MLFIVYTAGVILGWFIKDFYENNKQAIQEFFGRIK